MQKNHQGFALVVVLGVLALLVVLVVGFLVRATTERTAASGYSASVSARLLADSVVGVVQGQVNAATSQGSEVAWASQPGLIRTFAGTGNLLHAYKLYSADKMIAATVDFAADLPDATWINSPAVWTDLNAPVAGIYPILDPDAKAEGFSLAGVPAGSQTGANRLPLPVRWLYVLRNGEMVAPSSAGAGVTVAGASQANPIVGRVAFWTDDDTAKVNINTAAEGVFWDTPRAYTAAEKNLANYQPAQKEFQRYPGHPAMTSLRAVFPDLSPAEIYALVPRISGGGSEGGTAIAGGKIVPDTDRLYASIDELIFNKDRTKNSGIDKQTLEEARFFLTARSRAPEVNLFNLPRVACWPLYQNLSPSFRVNESDRLIAFCSTINGLPYYFQRRNADSPSSDIAIPRNAQLYAYLQALTEKNVPGFGGNFLGKYGTDRDQILTEIFDYIRSTNLFDDTLTTGNQFTDGYDGSRPRSGHGSVAPTVKGTGAAATRGFGRFATLSELAIGFICTAVADDDPSTPFDESLSNAGPAMDAGQNYKQVQAIIVPEFFCAMAGYDTLKSDLRIVIRGLEGFQYAGQNMGFPSSAQVDYEYDPGEIYGGLSVGGTFTYRYFGYGRDRPGTYPFISRLISFQDTGTANFSGGPITVEIRTKSTDALLQTLRLNVPGGDFPTPKLVIEGTPGSLGDGGQPPQTADKWWTFEGNGRLSFINHFAGRHSAPNNGALFLKDRDVVRSIVPKHGDYRLVAARETIDDVANPGNELFVPHPRYGSTDGIACYLSNCWIAFNGGFAEGDNIWEDPGSRYFTTPVMPAWLRPDIPSGLSGSNIPEGTGDFDTGLPKMLDGPYVNKPDEGNIWRDTATAIPYFDQADQRKPPGQTFFSPNRQMPSPGMFGSLPSRVKAGIPWTTLLFRPQAGHSGQNSPRDHLLLDLFWMPVVEPYAISEPFSTAGKINMNYQIVPFTFVTRATGMVALLKSERVAAIANGDVNTYKKDNGGAADIRLPVDISETLTQFAQKFSAGVFLSASEICDIHIVPEGETVAGMAAFWANHRLTGDNLREKIYTTLYPRLTTKSNTFTVHFRVQALRSLPSSQPATWTEGKDIVAGEYRGSTTIERFLPTTLPVAGDPAFVDYASHASGLSGLPTLDRFYRWRIIENRQFAP